MVDEGLGSEDVQECGGWGVTANEYWFSFGDDKNLLNLNSGDDCPTLGIWYTVNE